MSYAQVRKKLPLTSFVLRGLLVAFLVFATINPSKYTLTTWILASSAPLSIRLFIAFCMFAAWITLLRIAWQGLRAVGFFLVFFLMMILVLCELQFNILSGLSSFALSMVALALVTAFTTLGLVGSYLVRWITGQSPVVKNPP